MIDESDNTVEKLVSYYFQKLQKTRRLQKALHCWTYSTNGDEPLQYPSFMDVIPVSHVLNICNFTGLAKCFQLFLILGAFAFPFKVSPNKPFNTEIKLNFSLVKCMFLFCFKE